MLMMAFFINLNNLYAEKISCKEAKLAVKEGIMKPFEMNKICKKEDKINDKKNETRGPKQYGTFFEQKKKVASIEEIAIHQERLKKEKDALAKRIEFEKRVLDKMSEEDRAEYAKMSPSDQAFYMKMVALKIKVENTKEKKENEK